MAAASFIAHVQTLSHAVAVEWQSERWLSIQWLPNGQSGVEIKVHAGMSVALVAAATGASRWITTDTRALRLAWVLNGRTRSEVSVGADTGRWQRWSDAHGGECLSSFTMTDALSRLPIHMGGGMSHISLHATTS